ncbi:hypothetical protein N9W07_00160 [Alphaproteobacteria bacterium]|nr:hypothetical protein [Alphaproteobacteria bacterium]
MRDKYLIIKNNIVENTVIGEVKEGIPAIGYLANANIGDTIKNGKNIKPIIKINYKQERQVEYPEISEQLDFIYHDLVNGTTKWKDKITAIKNKYPKS